MWNLFVPRPKVYPPELRVVRITFGDGVVRYAVEKYDGEEYYAYEYYARLEDAKSYVTEHVRRKLASTVVSREVIL